jgi:hypothetical protein
VEEDLVAMGDITEDVARMWEKFNLMEEESVGIKTQEGDFEPLAARGSNCVVGKLLADRVVGKEVIRTPLIRAWQPSGWVSFKSVGENLFLIEFQYEWDKVRIMEGRPWTFDGDLVSLAKFDGLTPLAELEFEKAAFWVRMSNLPLACMSKEMGTRIGSTMGVVEEVEVDEDGVGWEEYLRVRIVLDLTKPLSRGRFLHIREKAIWITFKYEKIPRFCFKCGIIRHGGRGCIAPGGRRMLGNKGENQFGPWLRVTSGGFRNGGTGRGQNQGGWRNTAQVPDTSATSNRQKSHGGSAGSNAAEGEGATKGTTSLRHRSTDGKNYVSRKSQYPINESGIPRKPWNQGRKEIFSAGYGEDKGEQLPIQEEIPGDMQSGVKSKSDMILAGLNDTTEAGKGKSIYVGQWDAIREKMVWETLEKGAEVAWNGTSMWQKESMGDIHATPIRGFHGQGSITKGRTVVQRKNKGEASHDGLNSNGWKRSNETAPAANTSGTSAKKNGKKENSC